MGCQLWGIMKPPRSYPSAHDLKQSEPLGDTGDTYSNDSPPVSKYTTKAEERSKVGIAGKAQHQGGEDEPQPLHYHEKEFQRDTDTLWTVLVQQQLARNVEVSQAQLKSTDLYATKNKKVSVAARVQGIWARVAAILGTGAGLNLIREGFFLRSWHQHMVSMKGKRLKSAANTHQKSNGVMRLLLQIG